MLRIGTPENAEEATEAADAIAGGGARLAAAPARNIVTTYVFFDLPSPAVTSTVSAFDPTLIGRVRLSAPLDTGHLFGLLPLLTVTVASEAFTVGDSLTSVMSFATEAV